MTDLDKLRDAFTAVRVKFTEEALTPEFTPVKEAVLAIRIDNGEELGYIGFFCEFYFDAAGVMLGYASWE